MRHTFLSLILALAANAVAGCDPPQSAFEDQIAALKKENAALNQENAQSKANLNLTSAEAHDRFKAMEEVRANAQQVRAPGVGDTQPASTPDPRKPEDPCTIERARAENPTAETEIAAEREKLTKEFEEAVAAFKKALDNSRSVPAPNGIPRLPNMTVFRYAYVPTTVELQPAFPGAPCELQPSQYRDLEHTATINSWPQIGALALAWKPDERDDDANETAASHLTDWFFATGQMGFVLQDDIDRRNPVSKTIMKVIVVSEDHLRTLIPWALTLLSHASKEAQDWVAARATVLWKLSHEEFGELHQRLIDLRRMTDVESIDKTREIDDLRRHAESEIIRIGRGENGVGRLRGLLLRRWRDAGGDEKGDGLMLVYRFWLARTAKVLNMAEAQTWADEVILDLTHPNLAVKYRDWYHGQILN